MVEFFRGCGYIVFDIIGVFAGVYEHFVNNQPDGIDWLIDLMRNAGSHFTKAGQGFFEKQFTLNELAL